MTADWLTQVIRDLLEANDRSLNPVSIITDVQIEFEDEKMLIVVETFEGTKFHVKIEKVK